MPDYLSHYPTWFVIACATIVAAAAIWVISKLLKVALWLLLLAVILGGAALVLWGLFH